MRAAKVQASLRIRTVSPEPSLLAHTSSESRGTFRQKARSLAPLDDWACAVEICHDGILEDTNSFDGAQFRLSRYYSHQTFATVSLCEKLSTVLECNPETFGSFGKTFDVLVIFIFTVHVFFRLF